MQRWQKRGSLLIAKPLSCGLNTDPCESDYFWPRPPYALFIQPLRVGQGGAKEKANTDNSNYVRGPGLNVLLPPTSVF